MKEVLVVDDSPVVRKIARRILESMQYRTTEAGDGRQALSECSYKMPDGIFLDADMPVLDGYQFLKEVRRLPGGDRPKIVYCTLEHDVALIARAMHAGADDYILKPFDRDAMAAKFEKLESR